MLPETPWKCCGCRTIGPLIKQTITEGSLIYTDEYDIYSRLAEWGYG